MHMIMKTLRCQPHWFAFQSRKGSFVTLSGFFVATSLIREVATMSSSV